MNHLPRQWDESSSGAEWVGGRATFHYQPLTNAVPADWAAPPLSSSALFKKCRSLLCICESRKKKHHDDARRWIFRLTIFQLWLASSQSSARKVRALTSDSVNKPLKHLKTAARLGEEPIALMWPSFCHRRTIKGSPPNQSSPVLRKVSPPRCSFKPNFFTLNRLWIPIDFINVLFSCVKSCERLYLTSFLQRSGGCP